MTTEKWVHRLNKLAAEIEEYMHAIAPWAWATDEQLAQMNEQYKRLARQPSHDPEDDPQQMELGL